MDFLLTAVLLHEMQLILDSHRARSFSAEPADNLHYCISHQNAFTPFHNYSNIINSTIYVGSDNTNILDFHPDPLNEHYAVKQEISPPTKLCLL